MSKLFQTIKQIFRTTSANEKFVKFVGTDRFENKFYERLPGKSKHFKTNERTNGQENFFVGNRHYDAARRYYEPSDYENVRLRIDPSWEGELALRYPVDLIRFFFQHG